MTASEQLALRDAKTEAESEPLLPCPFCSSDGVMNMYHKQKSDKNYIVYFYVICANHECGCSLKFSLCKRKAIKAWNRRLLRLTLKTATP